MADLFEDRIHPATRRQRQQARREGRWPRSRDLASALVMLTALLTLMTLGENICRQLIETTRAQLAGAADGHIDPGFSNETVTQLWYQQVSKLGRVLLPLLGLIVMAAIAAHVGQTGFLFLPERALPEARNINPAGGLRRIVSGDNISRWLMGIARLAMILVVAGLSLWTHRFQLQEMIAGGPFQMVGGMLNFLLLTAVWICCGLVVLGVVDYAWQRWSWEQSMKMTSEQLREEQRLRG